MKLQELFPNISSPYSIEYITNDSREASQESLFIAYTGFEKDLHIFIPNAYAQGCRVFMIDSKYQNEFQDLFPDAEWIGVLDLKKESAKIVRQFYQYPDKKLTIIGITGTNGKTTTATLIDQSLNALGIKTAFFGTISWKIGDKAYPALNTTPDFIPFIKMLHQAVEQGITHVVMEVASHALSLGRVEGIEFDIAGFTNLTQDHLDFHHNMDEYFLAKKVLFSELLAHSLKSRKKAFINADDPYGQKILQLMGERGIPSESLSLEGIGSWNAEHIQLSVQNTIFELVHDEERVSLTIPLLGRINVQNSIMAYAILRELGFEHNQIEEVFQHIVVPGRLQTVLTNNGITFLIDYAHTPDALSKAVDVINGMISDDARSIVVFGAGGDRDKTKRPLMAKASMKADIIVVTSDNPRTEDPENILADILEGFEDQHDQVYSEINRKKAIKLAHSLAKKGDVILIAGKGHEDYQIIGTEKKYFSDIDEAEKYIN